MPIREYKCPNCWAKEEVLERNEEAKPPECCGAKMKRIISLPQPHIWKQTPGDYVIPIC